MKIRDHISVLSVTSCKTISVHIQSKTGTLPCAVLMEDGTVLHSDRIPVGNHRSPEDRLLWSDDPRIGNLSSNETHITSALGVWTTQRETFAAQSQSEFVADIDEVWTFEVRNFITPVRSNAHFLNGHSSEKIEAAKSSNANVTSFLDFMRLFGPEKSA